MKASLIFCSTSHSINVQKVKPKSIPPLTLDFQSRLIQGIRFEMYNPRNIHHRRTHIRIPERIKKGQSLSFVERGRILHHGHELLLHYARCPGLVDRSFFIHAELVI
jgi:hypothetical protein